MENLLNWSDFWSLVQTPFGLGVLVTATIGLLKRLNKPNLPAWLYKVGAFVAANAAFVSVCVALVYSLIVFVVSEYGLEDVVGKYFVIFALAWAASQGAYAVQKAGSMYVGRMANGKATTTATKSG